MDHEKSFLSSLPFGDTEFECENIDMRSHKAFYHLRDAHRIIEKLVGNGIYPQLGNVWIKRCTRADLSTFVLFTVVAADKNGLWKTWSDILSQLSIKKVSRAEWNKVVEMHAAAADDDLPF